MVMLLPSIYENLWFCISQAFTEIADFVAAESFETANNIEENRPKRAGS